MAEPRPVYIIGPSGSLRDRILEALTAARVVEAPEITRAAGSPAAAPSVPPGVVLLLADALPAEETLRVVEALAVGEGEWTPCLVREREGHVVVRTISVGFREGLEDVAASGEGDDDRLLELRRAMKRIARSRHDINNPLTSGMAETQLLLMDVQEPEAREGLETIQAQLRRIRDLVAATGGLRTRDD